MSSDDYYALRKHKANEGWALTHGFMSCVDDPGNSESLVFASKDKSKVMKYYESLDKDFMGEGYSEYGLAFIDEGGWE